MILHINDLWYGLWLVYCWLWPRLMDFNHYWEQNVGGLIDWCCHHSVLYGFLVGFNESLHLRKKVQSQFNIWCCHRYTNIHRHSLPSLSASSSHIFSFFLLLTCSTLRSFDEKCTIKKMYYYLLLQDCNKNTPHKLCNVVTTYFISRVQSLLGRRNLTENWK